MFLIRYMPCFVPVVMTLLSAVARDGNAPSGVDDKVREQIFSETDALIAEARAKNVELYSPRNFRKALESYHDADEAYRRGRNLEEIRGKLRSAANLLQQAAEVMKLGEVTFVSVVAARNDGTSADAPRYSPDLWLKAEAQFKIAAGELEDGDVQAARKEGALAETLYRNAELEAIKTNFLAPARELLRRAEGLDVKENAPKTLARATMLAAQAEALLKQNRYDTDEARQLAQDSKYEAAHAIYLHATIDRMKKAEQTFEDILLSAEEPLRQIAVSMNLGASFDQGFDPVAKAVTPEIRTRDSRASADQETIRQRQREMDNLKQQVTSMEGRLGTLSETEQQLKQDLTTQKEREETFAYVSALFTIDEGIVLREGKSTVLRLHGLTFPPARSSIEPQHYDLLGKVVTAIRKYPNCQVVVEGHTDSQGSDGANMTLSEDRAAAVAEYLRVILGEKISITSFGYGETKPVSTNETGEGRAKNRRIDITIVPQWAIVGR